MKKLNIFFVIVATMMAIYGCSMDKEVTKDNKEKEIILTERQKEILEQEQLPTEYDKLTYSQKNAIVAIEEMMSVTEKKYGISLCYISYSDGGYLSSSEEVFVYPEGGDETDDSFTIERKLENDEYIYSDGYVVMLARKPFNKFVFKYCSEKLGDGNVKVYSIIIEVANENIPVDENNIAHNVDGSNVIFINASLVSEEEYEKFIAEYKQWIKENGITSATQVILANEGVFKRVSKYNYTDYMSEEDCLRRDIF